MRFNVIFMGTPDFALPSLEMLIREHNVTAVVTKQDTPKGRGNKMTPPPVKVLASAHGIPVLQPQSARSDEFYDEMRQYPCDVVVTAAYGKILPQRVLDIPKYGTINVHAGLLPEYRGAAPLWHCIINGEKETGVTTMLTDAGMDTGDILLEYRCGLDDSITVGELTDKLAVEGAELLKITLEKLADGTLERRKQDDSRAGYAPMIKKEDAHIDWTKNAKQVHDLIRGTEPSPGSFTFYNGERFKIRKSEVLARSEHFGAPGEIIRVSKDGIDVAAGEGLLRILELQTDSSKRMDVASYLNGHKIAENTILC